jgi:hypothetical protein
VVGSSEHNNEPSVSIKGRVFSNQHSDCQFLKDSTPLGQLVGWFVGY